MAIELAGRSLMGYVDATQRCKIGRKGRPLCSSYTKFHRVAFRLSGLSTKPFAGHCVHVGEGCFRFFYSIDDEDHAEV